MYSDNCLELCDFYTYVCSCELQTVLNLLVGYRMLKVLHVQPVVYKTWNKEIEYDCHLYINFRGAVWSHCNIIFKWNQIKSFRYFLKYISLHAHCTCTGTFNADENSCTKERVLWFNLKSINGHQLRSRQLSVLFLNEMQTDFGVELCTQWLFLQDLNGLNVNVCHQLLQ